MSYPNPLRSTQLFKSWTPRLILSAIVVASIASLSVQAQPDPKKTGKAVPPKSTPLKAAPPKTVPPNAAGPKVPIKPPTANSNLKATPGARRYGLGGEVHKPAANEVLTPTRFKKVLNTPVGNPGLMERRMAVGANIGKTIPRMMRSGSKPTATATPTRPKKVDWRNRWGVNWISAVQDQNPSQNCWAFASTGLIEAMIRIEHGLWSERSVVEIRKGVNKTTDNGGNAHEALTWVASNGMADPDCTPFTRDNAKVMSTPDRNGRTVKIAKHERIPNDKDQESAKKWIDAVGPLVCVFEVYDDFDLVGSGVYRKKKDAKFLGRHLVLIIGYDDDLKCWICKNSWGTGWGDKGFFKIGYGEVLIDEDEKYGLSGTNPDPWAKRGMHNGNLLESGNGAAHRNFEVLIESGKNRDSLGHWWREGSGDLAWKEGLVFGNDVACPPTLMATTRNRNFESVHLTNRARLHHWIFDQASGKWQDGGLFGPTDAKTVPGFVQSDIGAPGQLEVVVATRKGTLSHWSKPSNGAWKETATFGDKIAYSGATLIQHRTGKTGNLMLVAVGADGKMQYWTKADTNAKWTLSGTFGADVKSVPVMIEGVFDSVASESAGDALAEGNLELVVSVKGQLQHWWRSKNGKNWQKSATFGKDIDDATGLLEGSFGMNLEVLALRNDKKLQHFWRDGRGWNSGVIFGPGAAPAPTTPVKEPPTVSAKSGNLEALVLEGNNLVHYWEETAKPWNRGGVVSRKATGPASITHGPGGNLEAVVLEGNVLMHYYNKLGNAWAPTAPVTTAATGPGSITTNGKNGNFEVCVLEGKNLVHYWTEPGKPWKRGSVITAKATGPGAITRGVGGNLDVVVLEGNNLSHYYNFLGKPFAFGSVITNKATGPGSIVINGGNGNLEVVVREGNELVTYWTKPGQGFKRGGVVSNKITGAGVIMRGPGSNLEILVPEGSNMVHYWNTVAKPFKVGSVINNKATGPAGLVRRP